MIVHPRGLKNLGNPGVWIFPKLSVCLGCGYSWFTFPKTELLLLAASEQWNDSQWERVFPYLGTQE
jgi:hypothetical protein